MRARVHACVRACVCKACVRARVCVEWNGIGGEAGPYAKTVCSGCKSPICEMTGSLPHAPPCARECAKRYVKVYCVRVCVCVCVCPRARARPVVSLPASGRWVRRVDGLADRGLAAGWSTEHTRYQGSGNARHRSVSSESPGFSFKRERLAGARVPAVPA